MSTTDTNHAIENATAWLASICEMVDALETLADENYDEDQEITIDGDLMATRDDVEQRIQESPLSVMVRSDWYVPGSSDERKAAEFEILLSTGGPALRIVGDLDEYQQPKRPRLQYQDWGAPWTEYIVSYDDPQHDAKRAALQTYCEQFYFGD